MFVSKTFPLSSDHRIALPAPGSFFDLVNQNAGPTRARGGPEGLQSWDVLFPWQDVIAAGKTYNDPTDVEGYLPIDAAYVQGCTDRYQGKCGEYPVTTNDCFSRTSWWLQNISGGGVSASEFPYPIDFLIRFANNCVGEPVFSGRVNLPSLKHTGLIVQVSGLLATQVEFWARLPVGATGIRVALALKVDRLGDETDKPVLGRYTVAA